MRKSIRPVLVSSFIRGTVIIIFFGVLSILVGFIDSLFASFLRLFLQPLNLSDALLNSPVRYLIMASAIVIVGVILKINATKSLLAKIPIVSIPIKVGETLEKFKDYPLVRIENYDGNRVLAAITGPPRLIQYNTRDEQKILTASGKPRLEFPVFIPDLPACMGGREVMIEPRRIELILNPKSEIFQYFLSVGSMGSEKPLHVISLKGLRQEQIAQLFNLTEEQKKMVTEE